MALGTTLGIATSLTKGTFYLIYPDRNEKIIYIKTIDSNHCMFKSSVATSTCLEQAISFAEDLLVGVVYRIRTNIILKCTHRFQLQCDN